MSLGTANKCKNQIEQKSIVVCQLLLSVNQLTSMVYHGSFGMSLCSSVSL